MPISTDPRSIHAQREAGEFAGKLSERIATLSIAVLSFTIGFRDSFIGAGGDFSVWLLRATWVFMTFALLLSLFASYRPIDMRESLIQFLARNPNNEDVHTVAWRGFIYAFRGSLICFGLGALALLCFGVGATAQYPNQNGEGTERQSQSDSNDDPLRSVTKKSKAEQAVGEQPPSRRELAE